MKVIRNFFGSRFVHVHLKMFKNVLNNKKLKETWRDCRLYIASILIGFRCNFWQSNTYENYNPKIITKILIMRRYKIVLFDLKRSTLIFNSISWVKLFNLSIISPPTAAVYLVLSRPRDVALISSGTRVHNVDIVIISEQRRRDAPG